MENKPISIIDALNQISLTNIGYQILNKALTKASKKRNHTEITLVTDVTPNQLISNERVGVIVWMGKSEYQKWLIMSMPEVRNENASFKRYGLQSPQRI